jgi:hypothetical protein
MQRIHSVRARACALKGLAHVLLCSLWCARTVRSHDAEMSCELAGLYATALTRPPCPSYLSQQRRLTEPCYANTRALRRRGHSSDAAAIRSARKRARRGRAC